MQCKITEASQLASRKGSERPFMAMDGGKAVPRNDEIQEIFSVWGSRSPVSGSWAFEMAAKSTANARRASHENIHVTDAPVC